LLTNHKHIIITCLWLFFLCKISVFAQDSIFLEVKTAVDLPATTSLSKKNYQSIEQAKNALELLAKNLKSDGYFAVSIDSFQNKQDTLSAYLHLGNLYPGISMDISNLEEAVKRATRMPLEDTVDFNLKEWNSLNEKLLQYSENNGYPFAEVKLDDVLIENGTINAKLNYKQGEKFLIDSIEIRGTSKLNNKYVQNYLDLKKGEVYNEEKIRQASQRLKELPFVKSSRSPAVEFFDNGARLFLFMNGQEASRFDFLLGLAPNTRNDSQRNFTITGEGVLSLVNIFGFGEKFHIEYKNYPSGIKELKSQIASTYLPFVPLGTDIQFNLHIKDTLYINRNFEFGLLYPLKGNNYAKVFYKFAQSNLLGLDTKKIIEEQQLPGNLDWKHQNYGIAFNYEKLDYRNNPQKGIKISAFGSVGTKTILENSRITQLKIPSDTMFNFKSLYQDQEEKSVKTEIGLRLDKYWLLKKGIVLKTSINSSYLYAYENEANVLESELYRIGGLQSIRGFDEQSIIANWFNILTLEFRYLIGENSFFSLFSDFSYIQNTSLTLEDQPVFDWPIGFGAGLNFETSAGIFSLNYGLGRRTSTKLNLKSGKIHFGYLNLF